MRTNFDGKNGANYLDNAYNPLFYHNFEYYLIYIGYWGLKTIHLFRAS